MNEEVIMSRLFLSFHLFVISSLLTGRHLEAAAAAAEDKCAPVDERVCKDDGDGSRQKGAIEKAFSSSSSSSRQEMDVIFVICMTHDCVGTSSPTHLLTVTSFIVKLLNYLAISYGVKIDPTHVHAAIVAYNYSTTWTLIDRISGTKGRTIDSCQFVNITRNLPTPPYGEVLSGCKLTGALDEAKRVFVSSSRPNAKRIAWVFSDCRNCARNNGEQNPVSTDDTTNSARALKAVDVTVFTVGISKCPGGFFDTKDKEELLRSVASSNDSHFACIDSWSEFLDTDSPSGSTVYADVGEGVDPLSECGHCETNTSPDNRCMCDVVGDVYRCRDLIFPPPTPSASLVSIVIGVGVGVGSAVIVIIVIVIIIVVVCHRRGRRCCCHNGPPPPVPRRHPPVSPPAPPPRQQQYQNSENCVEEIDYEIFECERQMDGWSSHLVAMKNDFNILDLGIYSLEGDYFAQTPGFSLMSPQERTKIIEIMESHHHHRHRPHRLSLRRQVLSVSVASIEFIVDNRTLSESSLSAKSSDKVLQVVYRDGYMAIGVSRLNQGSGCQSAVEQVLDDVTRQYF